MNSRILTIRKGLSLLSIGRDSIGRRKYGFDRPHCDSHMNELPVPTEEWGPRYSKKQSGYTKVLLIGLSSFVFSIYMVVSTNSFDPVFSPPDRPAEPSELKKGKS